MENLISTICTCGAGLEASFDCSTYNTLCIQVEPCVNCAEKTVLKAEQEAKARTIFEKHYYKHPSTTRGDLDY